MNETTATGHTYNSTDAANISAANPQPRLNNRMHLKLHRY